jgi:pilus assembly protein CpaB
MNLKALIPLALAVVLGLVAAFAAKNMLAQNHSAQPNTKLTQVVVAKVNIPPGTELTADDVTTVKMEADVDPQAIFTNPDDVLKRVAAQPLYKGQPVINTLLAPKGTGGGLQALVPEGMRAITIEVNEFLGVAGFVTPGSRVDVISSMAGDKGGEMVARTIVQNVRVTAVGSHLAMNNDDNKEPLKSVTLIATPKEAQAIELACATGRPRLVLRSSGDQKVDSSIAGVSVSELRGQQNFKIGAMDPFAQTVNMSTTQPTHAVAIGEVRSVKVIRAGVESEVAVPLPDESQGTDSKQDTQLIKSDTGSAVGDMRSPSDGE